MRLLVVNAGSSTLKLRLLDGDEVQEDLTLAADAGRFESEELAAALDRAGAVDAVGHRVVHGGSEFTGPALITDGSLARLAALTPLAPLHQPAAVGAIEATRRRLPGAVHVACFDTAFHATLPEPARLYAVPEEWRRRHGVRRFGFHGLNHAWVARRAAELAPGARRTVSCHLGSGASLCALQDGVSVDTTMGMTPLEGLVMGTRAGSVDPGALLLIQEWEAMPAHEMYDRLDRESGLRGLTGTADMREVAERERRGDGTAALARAHYVHRLAAAVCAMLPALGGLDALAFTAGVGENDAGLRARVADRLAFLGVAVDAERNRECRPDADVSASSATVRSLVVAAREDLEIARQVRQLLGR